MPSDHDEAGPTAPPARPRGDAFQVILFAGRDPLTGQKLYLRQTVATEPRRGNDRFGR